MLKNKSDFYPALVKSFTYNDKFYCAPKDFSTLQLVINTDLWKAAGLTDSDIPDDLGPARGRRQEADHGTEGGSV